jgi:flagellar biogenesis protein FliO
MNQTETMTDTERQFAAKAIRRKQLFRTISNVSIAVALLLAVVYGFERLHNPSFQLAPRAVIILLILLNARQNLRQHKYAAILEKLTRPG